MKSTNKNSDRIVSKGNAGLACSHIGAVNSAIKSAVKRPPKASSGCGILPNGKVFYGWWIALASAIGLSLGYSVIAMSFGTFIKEFEETFGWTRGQISFGSTVIGITAILFFPYAGMLVDRYGVKNILLPSTFLFGLVMASMSLLTPSIWHFYAMCILIPLLGAGTAPLTYSRLLVSWFDKKRGLALGIGLSGVGLGTAIVPLIASYFIEHYSWRQAYLAIGGLIILLVWPMARFVLVDKPDDKGLVADGIALSDDEASAKRQARVEQRDIKLGYTAQEAVKSKVFWLMLGSFLITGLTTSTLLVHLVPMMMDRGASLQEAVETFAYLGISVVGGRLIAGYLMDKFFAPYVVAIFMLGPILGLAAFSMGASGEMALISTGLIGIAIGAEFDAMAYFTTKYFGKRSFGVIYGYSYTGFKLGACIGPLVMGLAYDRLGRYTEVLWAMSATMALGCVLILCMGAYPSLPSREVSPKLGQKSSQGNRRALGSKS